MLQDLDKTLETFLRSELPSELQGISISFAAPDEKFPPQGVSLPAISLFLSGIQENRDLRQTEPVVARLPDSSPTVKRPAARVDCYYLATAFSNATTNPEADEHRILGQLMMTLFRFRELPAQALQGGLRNTVVPVRVSTPLPTNRESGVDMWQAFKVKPRAALHYTLTISVDPANPAYSQPPVSSVQTQGPANPPPDIEGVGSSMAPLAINGRITDSLTNQPLAGALVQLTQVPDTFAGRLATLAAQYGDAWNYLQERPERTRSRPDGSYGFLNLPDGTYALSVSLPLAGLRYGAGAASAIAVARDAEGRWITATVNVALPPTSIKGRVVDSSATPIKMAEVRIIGSGESTFTDAQGNYALTAIEPGQRQLEGAGAGFPAKPLPQPVTVTQGQQATAPDLVLVP